jgi:archaellum component FlaC
MDNNLQPIFDYFDAFEGRVNLRFEKLDNKVDTLQTSVDNLTKIVQDFRDEHIILRRQFELLRAWAEKVSEKVGVPLPELY